MRHHHLLGMLVAVLVMPAGALADAPLAVTPPGNGGYTRDTTPTLSGTAHDGLNDGTLVTVTVNSGNNDYVGVATRSGTTWSIEAGETLPEGRHLVTIAQERNAGATTDTATGPLIVDTTAPVIGALKPVGVGTTPDGRPMVYSPFNLAFVLSETGLTFDCAMDTAAFASCGTRPVTGIGLAPGDHLVRARAIDRAGNVGPAVEQSVLVVPRLMAPWPTGFVGGVPTRVDLVLPARVVVPNTGRIMVPVKSRNVFTLTGALEVRTKDRLRNRGSARRTRILASRSAVRIGGLGPSVVRVRLPRAQRALLRRAGRLPVRVTLTLVDAAGQVRVVRAETTLMMR